MVKNNKLKFYYFVTDLDMLSRTRTLVSRLVDEAEHIIFDNLDNIDENIANGVFLIDSSIDFFMEKFSENENNNVLIVINDILNDYQDYPYEVYISKSKVLTSLSAILYDLQNTAKYDSNYFCVEINNIIMNQATPCDIFVRISDKKFLKCMHKGDIFDRASKERFLKKSNYLWVGKADFFLFGDFLYGLEDLEREINVPFTAENMDHMALIHDMAHSCGISDKTIRRVEKTIEAIRSDSNKKLNGLFDRFDDLSGSFLFSHSYLTALLCIEVGSKMSWFRHQHIDKLTMASIVHDLGYKNKDNALNEALPKSKVKQLEANAMEDTLNHIDVVLEILESANVLDSDIINIIKKHHGCRGDESYPNKSFTTEVDLLSGIFLLCHSFVVSFYKMSFDKSKVDKILAYIDLVYNKGDLKKIMPDFKKEVISLINK